MNGYDFDNTLYDGESPFDFFAFCLKKKKKLIIYIPLAILSLIQYKLKKLSMEKLIGRAEKIISCAFESEEQVEKYVDEFWKKNESKLKKDILSQVSEEDIIITASPRFLIEKIQSKLVAKNLLCSEFNIKTGKLEFVCFRQNKVKKFKELFPKQKLKSFYSDSLNDLPMMKLAKNAYLVKKNKIEKYEI